MSDRAERVSMDVAIVAIAAALFVWPGAGGALVQAVALVSVALGLFDLVLEWADGRRHG